MIKMPSDQEIQAQDFVTIQLLNSEEYRKSILGNIASWENKERKFESFKQFECFHERSRQYVVDYLNSQFSKETVNSMPIVDTIHISKRVVEKKASIYTDTPYRTLTGLSDDQAEEVREFYAKKGIDAKLGVANEYYKLQDQATLWVAPANGKMKVRCLLPHQFDVIPNMDDPEEADAYIVNTFDRSYFFRPTSQNGDGQNQKIADPDDYKGTLNKFLVWTKFVNFIMDGTGAIISPILPNQIGRLPFVDLACSKDSEFFVRGGRGLTDFSIQFNGVLSDAYNVVKMQGWAVGYLKAAANMMPENLTVGPNHILRLPIDPNNPSASAGTEFGYASPNADIPGTMLFIETLMSLFLTSNGLDAKAISMKLNTQQFASGLDRLLAMLDVFEASKDDFKVFKKAEQEMFDILSLWSNLFVNSPNENEKIFSFVVPENVQVDVNFAEPKLVQTDSEKTANLEKKMQLKLISYKEAIMADRGIDEEAAEEVIVNIQSEAIEMAKQKIEALDKAGFNTNGADSENPKGQIGEPEVNDQAKPY